MRINYNVSAMLSNNALSTNDDLLSKSLERLSSGLKINHAKDNPAGLAMSKRMNAQIEGLSVANQNASDGVSIIEIADGAMTEISEMLQRINELSVKAANGTMSDTDRATVQDEVKQLKEEITRISDVTEFNGQKLLNGEYDLKGYTNKQEVKVNYYSTDVPVKEYTIKSIPLTKDADGNIVLDGDVTFGDGFPDAKTLKTELKDDLLTITGENGFEMRLDVSGTLNGAQTGTTVKDLKINATGIGAMRLQIGANEHQVLEVNIPAVSLQNMGIENVDVSTAEGADDAIDRVDGAIKYVSFRSRQTGGIPEPSGIYDQQSGYYQRKYDFRIFPYHGCRYGGRNDFLYDLSDPGTGRNLHAGTGQRETVSGTAVVTVGKF